MLGCLLLCQRNTRLCQEKILLLKIHFDLSKKYKALSGEYLKNTLHFDYTLCFPEKFQGFVGRIAEELQTAGDIPSWVELPVFHRSNISLSAQVHRSRPNLLSYEAFQDLVKRISEHLSKLDGASFLFLHKSNISVLVTRNVG